MSSISISMTSLILGHVYINANASNKERINLMSCVISLALLMYGMVSNDGAIIMAAGLFAIAAEISYGIHKMSKSN